MSLQTCAFLDTRSKVRLAAAGYTTVSQLAGSQPLRVFGAVHAVGSGGEGADPRQGSHVSNRSTSHAAEGASTTTPDHHEHDPLGTVVEVSRLIQRCGEEVAHVQGAVWRGILAPPSHPAGSAEPQLTRPEGEMSQGLPEGVVLTPLVADTAGGYSAVAWLPAATSHVTSATFSELCGAESARPRIVTFSRALDDLLGGGVPLGSVTEVVGAPGIGKTQLSMQLSAAVQLPASFGGLDGACLYIDTEGSFVPQRCHEIATAAAGQVQKVVQLQRLQMGASAGPDFGAVLARYRADDILGRVETLRVTTTEDLTAAVHCLPDLVHAAEERIAAATDHVPHEADGASHPPQRVKLVIIDSMAFLLRAGGVADHALRSRLVQQVAAMLQHHARALDVAIVVTNHVTQGPGASQAALLSASDASRTVPQAAVPTSGSQSLHAALGDSWAHAVDTRLWLLPNTGAAVDLCVLSTGRHADTHAQAAGALTADTATRVALLTKSPSRPRDWGPFRISNKGIRNIGDRH